MGSLYVSQYVATGCPELSCRAYRVLLRMALVCLDEESQPGANDEGLYFQGWRALTVVLGYGVIHEDTPLPKRVLNQIDRSLRELRDHGYVVIPGKAKQRGHWNKAYRLTLIPVLDALNTPPRV